MKSNILRCCHCCWNSTSFTRENAFCDKVSLFLTSQLGLRSSCISSAAVSFSWKVWRDEAVWPSANSVCILFMRMTFLASSSRSSALLGAHYAYRTHKCGQHIYIASTEKCVELIHRARTSEHTITNYSSAQYYQKSRWVANIVWREACLSVVSINAQRVFQTRWKNRATPGATAIFGNLEVGLTRERSLLHVKTLIKTSKTHPRVLYLRTEILDQFYSLEFPSCHDSRASKWRHGRCYM